MAVSGSIETLRSELTAIADDQFCADLMSMARGAVELLTPPEQISTTECAAKHRKLPSPEGVGHIDWSPDLTPYMTGIQDALDDGRTQIIVVIKPGRVGGTVGAENHLLKRLKFGPMTDTLWYLAGPDEVESYIDNVVAPMFDLHPDIAAKIGAGRSDNKRTFKRIAGRKLEYLPINRKTITNRQAGYIVVDEIDSANAKLRSTMIDQIRVRGRTLGSRRKAYICSHPDAGWTSGVGLAYKESNRGLWYWPCPHCGDWSSPCPPAQHRMKLDYERLQGVSDDDAMDHVAATACLLCPHCGSAVLDEHKATMLLAGKWVFEGQTIDPDGTVTGEPRSRATMGFWIHGTMSPFVSLPDLAKEVEGAKRHYERTKKPEKIREVTAKSLGEIYEGSEGGKKATDAEALSKAAKGSGFVVGQVPPEVLFITAAVDVGHRKFDVGFWGWDRDGRSWLLDRVTLKQRRWSDGVMRDLRNKERFEDWTILESEVIDRKFPLADQPDMALPVACICIDVGDGNTTKNGREFGTRMAHKKWRNFPRVKLIRGAKLKTAPELPVRGAETAKDEQGNALVPSVLEWQLGVHKLKSLIVERLAVDDDGPGQCYFADGLPLSVFSEFVGEVLIDGEWERRGDNETLDLAAYAEAARQMLKPDRADINWIDKLPIWATPVPIASRGGDLAVAGEGQTEAPAPKKTTILSQFNALNNRR